MATIEHSSDRPVNWTANYTEPGNEKARSHKDQKTGASMIELLNQLTSNGFC
jgi:hypothetical protein